MYSMSPHTPDNRREQGRLAIMQPYLFPYLGYYQLVASVKKFVFLDDVNFIKRGWINRNRLIFSGNPKYFTVPLLNASQFRKISDIEIAYTSNWQKKILASISQSYCKAPYFHPTFDLVHSILGSGEIHISEMAKASVRAVSDLLGLPTQFVDSAKIYNNASLKAENRILDICRQEQTGFYYNLPSGENLYDPATFLQNGIELQFVTSPVFEYFQHATQFHPALSIIDVLMFNSADEIKQLLVNKPD